MISTSDPSDPDEMIYELRWMLIRAWAVMCSRKWLIVSVTLGVIAWVVVCLLSIHPIYSAVCRIVVNDPSSFLNYYNIVVTDHRAGY